MEFIFQLLFELVFQILVEGFFDVVFGKKLPEERPIRRFLFFLFVGAVFGGLSLLVFRSHIVDDRYWRCVAAVIVPIVIGILMAWIGRLRTKRGAERNDLEYFFSSWGFAFAFGAVRVIFAK